LLILCVLVLTLAVVRLVFCYCKQKFFVKLCYIWKIRLQDQIRRQGDNPSKGTVEKKNDLKKTNLDGKNLHYTSHLGQALHGENTAQKICIVFVWLSYCHAP